MFFVKTEGGGDQVAPAKRILASIKLDGSDPHEYYLSELATEFEVSPDGRWLAFREGFNAYVTPFVETGRRVDIGPKSKAVPVTRVSRDAGEYLHFSGDSARVFWAVGPQLFQRDLKEAFAFLPGAPEKLPEPPARGVDIGFTAPVDEPSSTLAFTGGRVVTMKGDEVIEDGVVVVQGNRIAAVGRRGQIAIPQGAKTVDVTGKTVLPGFIDAHYHGAFGGGDEILPQQNWHSDASLAFGVTTVHDPSNDTGEVFAAAELARAGLMRAPRIFSTGTILYGAAGDFKAEIDSLDDALAHLRRLKAVGAITVKSYNQPRREQRQQILAAAREVGMMVVPEGGSLFEMNMTMVVDGHTTVEHTIPVPNAYADVHALWPPGGVAYTPTLLVAYGGLFGENYWYQKTNVWEDPRLSRFVPPFILDPRSRRRTMAPDDEFNHFNEARLAAGLARGRRGRQHRGARPARGPGAPLGALDARAGRTLPARGSAVRHGQRRADAGHGPRPRHARGRQARRHRGHRRESAPGHPPVGEGDVDHGQRPPLRRRDDGRDRIAGEEAVEILVGVNVASACGRAWLRHRLVARPKGLDHEPGPHAALRLPQRASFRSPGLAKLGRVANSLTIAANEPSLRRCSDCSRREESPRAQRRTPRAAGAAAR